MKFLALLREIFINGNFCKVMLQSLPKVLVTVIGFLCLTNEII